MVDIQNNILGIYTKVEQERDFYLEILSHYFQDYLELVNLDQTNPQSPLVVPKAIIVTRLTEKAASERFPRSRIIYARRAISGQNLVEVIKIRKGTSVLVVNYPERIANETLEGLRSLGIDHLNLVPYWPGCEIDTSGFDIAIYAGIRAYCPPNIKKYINIGNRSFAGSTLMEIIQTFNLPFQLADRFFQDRYMKIIVEGCYRIADNLRKANAMKENFEQVCNLDNNISINIDHSGLIKVFNPAAEEFFETPKDAVIGKSYLEFFKDYDSLLKIISTEQPVQETIISVKQQQLVATIYLFSIDGNNNLLLKLLPVKDLQNSEAKVRVKLHSKGFTAKYHFENIKGDSEIIRKTVNLARHYAKTDATVLLTGESGTGKELFAQSIHNASKRFAAPFVGINFAALPETLAESELFGYVEGAFTGAAKCGKPGLFEIAHGGTIFLDEIGDASLPMQAKLLRVIEEREIVKVGSSSVLPVDVRIICATNKDLPRMTQEGKFREDLYYRIRVLTLYIPSLRERIEDIPSILLSSKKFSQIAQLLPNNLYERLMQYNWPGNVRELKSITEYLSILEQFKEMSSLDFAALANDLINQFFVNKISDIEVTSSHTPEQKTSSSPSDLLEEDLAAILKQIAALNKKNMPIGRCSLAELDPLKEINLTEAKIKTRLKRLEDRGYLTIGKTKQGVSLTRKALSVLQHL